MNLGAQDLEYICKLVRDKSAISLEASKEYLIVSRLEPLAKKEGFPSLLEFIYKLRKEPHNGMHWKVVEAMTTNETSFFRDFNPFEALRKIVIPELIKKREAERQLNIWCAACSSGQEPYSLAMLIREQFPSLLSWKLRIICTDISKEMLKRAKEGKFSQIEVNRGLPATHLIKYFKQHGLEWQINDDLKKLMEFHELNLAESWPPVLPALDLIFMRNVMIYFETQIKKEILGRVKRVLKKDGYLILGGAETTINIDDSFDRIAMEGTGFYRIKNQEQNMMQKAA